MAHKPNPEHLVDPHFHEETDFEQNWIKGVQTRASAGECSTQAPRFFVNSWEPERRAGGGPGASELQASEAACDTQYTRSRGVIGLGVSTLARFNPQVSPRATPTTSTGLLL